MNNDFRLLTKCFTSFAEKCNKHCDISILFKISSQCKNNETCGGLWLVRIGPHTWINKGANSVYNEVPQVRCLNKFYVYKLHML